MTQVKKTGSLTTIEHPFMLCHKYHVLLPPQSSTQGRRELFASELATTLLEIEINFHSKDRFRYVSSALKP